MLRIRFLGAGGKPATLSQKLLGGVLLAAVLAVVVLLLLGLWVVGAVVLTGAAVVGLVRALLPRSVTDAVGRDDGPRVIEGRATTLPDEPGDVAGDAVRVEREPRR